jgi:sterol desaturase/sphingolipid hydroxylase (fatty acid hydroxylase superfamily)
MIHNIVFYIFSYDIWFYISHIMLHRKYLYKAIHKEHHLVDPKIMTYKDTYVANYLESAFQGVGVLFPLLFINYNTYELLCSLIFLNMRGMLRHDNRCAWLVGNHHLLHHTYPNYNFGEYWLDRTFGTHYHGCMENKN